MNNPVVALKEITIVLAEDQKLMREGIKSLLEDEPHLKVIGEAENGRVLLDLLKHIKPDIILLDIDMPVMNGREALEIINKRYPEIKVIMLSMHDDEYIISSFMTMGARSYLAKGCDGDILIETIEAVNRNGRHFSDSVSKAMLTDLKHEKSIHHEDITLTPREIEILKALCDGKTNQEIANELHISCNTVHFHRGNVYHKTKSQNISDLIKYAIKNGFIVI